MSAAAPATLETFPYSLSADGCHWMCGMPGCSWSKPKEKKSLIVYHKNTHFPKYRCADCGECFPQKANLEVHTRVAHTRETPYSCDQCERSFVQLSNLQDHKRKIHNGSPKAVALDTRASCIAAA